jgi:hypothetical protein
MPIDEQGVNFFVSWESVQDLSGKRPDEASGYRIMLMSDDLSLKVAILLEGALVDYMFRTPSSGTRADLRESLDASAKLKNFIRVQSEERQKHIVAFYVAVLTAMIAYHKEVESYGVCWCCVTEKAKRKLKEMVLAAYYDLYAVLYDPV